MANLCATQKKIYDLNWGGDRSVENNNKLCTIGYSIAHLGAKRKTGYTNTTTYPDTRIVTLNGSGVPIEIDQSKHITGLIIKNNLTTHTATTGYWPSDNTLGYLMYGHTESQLVGKGLTAWYKWSDGSDDTPANANWSISLSGEGSRNSWTTYYQAGNDSWGFRAILTDERDYCNKTESNEHEVGFIKWFSNSFNKFTITAISTNSPDGNQYTGTIDLNYSGDNRHRSSIAVQVSDSSNLRPISESSGSIKYTANGSTTVTCSEYLTSVSISRYVYKSSGSTENRQISESGTNSYNSNHTQVVNTLSGQSIVEIPSDWSTSVYAYAHGTAADSTTVYSF